MKKLLVALTLLSFTVLHSADALADPVVKVYAGVNTASFQGGFPSDFELGGTARASLSDHLSLVGGTFYGFGGSYLRGSAGVRVTATDVNDPNFNVGFGISYQASSEPTLRPQEWCPEVVVGYRLPAYSKVIIGAQGSYGLNSRSAMLVLAARYNVASF